MSLQYISTRAAKPAPSMGGFEDILLEGLAQDGGLAMPEAMPAVSMEEMHRLAEMSYPALAADIISRFADDIDRSELHRLLKCLSERDWLGASALLANAAEWPPEKLEAALAPYFEERKAILCHHEARKAEFTTLRTAGDCSWDAWQTLVDPERENDWRIEAIVSLDPELEHAPARFLNLLAVTS
jgi:hypothetical protein